MAAILCVPTEAESYGYCRGQAVDAGPMMPAAQFHVTEERGPTCAPREPWCLRGVSLRTTQH